MNVTAMRLAIPLLALAAGGTAALVEGGVLVEAAGL